MLTNLTTEPKLSYSGKLDKPDKELVCLTPFSHAVLSHPVTAMLAREKDGWLSLLRIDQPSLPPEGCLHIPSIQGHDKHSIVQAVQSHPLIDGVVAIGTSAGIVMVAFEALAVPQVQDSVQG